jgi:prevent-host-death family protein
MHSVSVAHAKSHFSEVLNSITQGEVVIITRRGQPIARIESIQQAVKPLPDLASLRARFPKMKTPSAKIIRQLRDEGY